MTHAELKKLLHYDPETGIFTWKVNRQGHIKKGDHPSSKSHGYARVKVMGASYQGHRLAWFYMLGGWPPGDIDHRDGVRDNNIWANLRDVSSANHENLFRPKSHNKSGYLGVYPRRGKWCAAIGVEGKKKYLGQFNTPELASAAYLQAKSEHHKYSPMAQEK